MHVRTYVSCPSRQYKNVTHGRVDSYPSHVAWSVAQGQADRGHHDGTWCFGFSPGVWQWHRVPYGVYPERGCKILQLYPQAMLEELQTMVMSALMSEIDHTHTVR
jgi:hypothetical protein